MQFKDKIMKMPFTNVRHLFKINNSCKVPIKYTFDLKIYYQTSMDNSSPEMSNVNIQR